MSKPVPDYVDGYVLPDQELSVIPPPTYPFATNPTPDIFSRVQERDYNVLPKLYAPRIANRTSWTNLLTSSEVFSAIWTANAVTPTDNAVTAPDGNVTMAKLIETSSTAEHSVSRSLTLTAAPSVISVFAATGLGRDWIRLKYVDSAAAVYYCFFNVTAGYAGLSSNCTGKITPLPGGRFRCMILFTPAAGAGTVYFNASADGVPANISYAGNTADGIYVWGAEAKTAASAGPYVSTTASTRTVTAPDQDVTINARCDQSDPLSYLCEESDPKLITSAFGEVTRKFARVPNPQTVYSSIAVTKPDAASLGISFGTLQDATSGLSTLAPIGPSFRYIGYLWCSTDSAGNTLAPGSVYTQKLASVLTGTPVATSGLFQITYKTSTTGALNWNDSSGTISAAVNALTDVSGDGLTVTVTNRLADATYGGLQFAIVVGSTTSPFTASTVSLNPKECRTNFPIINSPTSQGIYCSCQATITAHGFATSGNLVASATPGNGNTVLFAYTTGWKVVDSNTIAFNGTPFSAAASVYFGPLLRNYTVGVDRLRTQRITSFYLPGVTPGISSPTDITIPNPALNDATFLGLVVNYLSGYQTYDAEALAQYLGPIYEQTLIQIDMATV